MWLILQGEWVVFAAALPEGLIARSSERPVSRKKFRTENVLFVILTIPIVKL
jgi:hypothetical protein